MSQAGQISEHPTIEQARSVVENLEDAEIVVYREPGFPREKKTRSENGVEGLESIVKALNGDVEFEESDDFNYHPDYGGFLLRGESPGEYPSDIEDVEVRVDVSNQDYVEAVREAGLG